MTKPNPRSTAAKRGGSAASPKPAAKASGRKAGGRPPSRKTAARSPTAPPPETASSAGRWKRPENLQDEAAGEWWEPVVAELRSRGRLHLLVPVQVEQFCQLLAQWWNATRALELHGTQVDECITNSGNVRRSVAPEVRLQLDLLATLRRLAKDFGLNEVPLSLKPGKEAGPNGTRDALRKLLESALQGSDAG